MLVFAFLVINHKRCINYLKTSKDSKQHTVNAIKKNLVRITLYMGLNGSYDKRALVYMGLNGSF